MAYTSWSSEKSYDGGKYKVRIKYSYSESAITWNYEFKITDKFKSGHYISWRHKKADGSWSEYTGTSSKKSASFDGDSHTYSLEQLQIQIGPSTSKKSKPANYVSITVPISTSAPKPPTSIGVKKLNDAHYTVTVSGSSYTTRPTDEIVVERQELNGSWSAIDDGEDHTIKGSTYTDVWEDVGTQTGKSYRWRAKAKSTGRSDSSYVMSGTEYTAPETNESPDVQKGNGYNTLTWSVSDVYAIDSGSLEGWNIQCSVNGGSFTTIDTVNAKASQYEYSYTHYTVAGNNYNYRLQAFGAGGTSPISGGDSGDVSTPPSAPYRVTAYRTPEDYVKIYIVDEDNNADDVLIERKVDSGNWTQIANEDYPCEQFIDTTVVGTAVQYRVRNKNSDGYSDYTMSNEVPLLSKPNPPSLISPFSGAVIPEDSGTVRLVWRHNSTDGSPQRQAELKYTLNGQSHTLSFTDASYAEIEIIELASNVDITWQVRTKGSHADWSNWSEINSFIIIQKPTLAITSPDNAEVIDALPIVIDYYYEDLSGELKELTVDIIKDNRVVETFVDEQKTGSFSLAKYLFDNGEVYGLRVNALSTTGLQASDLISVTIQYEPISIDGGLLPVITTDEETGFAYIVIERDITDDVEPVDIAEAYLYRKHEGERTLLGKVEQDLQIIDKYAPLNVPYQYELLQMTEDGDLGLIVVETEQHSLYSFIYFGDEVYRAIWTQDFNKKLGRPERVEKIYSGRKYPVSYDSEARSETDNFSTEIFDRDDVVALKRMMREYGQGIWKSADGDAYNANFDVSWQTNRYDSTQIWKASLNVTRIE